MRAAVTLALTLLLGGTAAARPAAAGADQAFPFAIESHTLPNGLHILLVPYDSPGLVAYFTAMRVGSRNEPEPGRSGYAHFFEHMMFRGTPSHSGDEYSKITASLGLSENAFTSDDMTVYHLYGPAKGLPTIIELESDRFQHLQYDEAQFKTEAGAILGEYAKSASNPEERIDEKLRETAFTAHTYRHTTIGYLADVKAMPSGFAYSREFFRRYYTPDNATIIIVGDFDRVATLAQLTKAYSGWKGKLDAAPITPEPAQTEPRSVHVDWKAPTLPRLVLAWHTPSPLDVDAAAATDLLDGYLFGPTSPLYQDLVIQRQLVDAIYSNSTGERDPQLYGIEARVKKASDLDEVQKAISAEIAQLAAGKVDAKRLDAVRSNLKYGRVLRMDTAAGAAVTLARAVAASGDAHYLDKEGAAVARLKPAALSAFAKKWLVDSNRTTLTLTSGGAQ